MRIPAPLVLTLLSACTWVSTDEIDGRRGAMDDDEDGFNALDDCNDNDPSISPGSEEVWYDGIDSDCLQDDDFDADQDGFVTNEFIGYQTNGVDGTGQLPGGDCNEEDASVHPFANDPWYDGIDSDCNGADDYDQDDDGYQSSEYNDDPAKGGGDCDDIAFNINPGAEDAWYSGIDEDCGGEDDYDADQDGHASADQNYGSTTYVDSVELTSTEDCDDNDSSVHPGITELWYDGVDSDCLEDDDFDADQDGYVLSIYQGLVTNGFCTSDGSSDAGKTEIPCTSADTCEDDSGLIWTCTGNEGTGSLPGGECDDNDSEANPGAIEVLSDAVDRDCDGAPDTLALSDIDLYTVNIDLFTWVNPFRPRFASNGTDVFLSLVMEEGYYLKSTGISSQLYDSAVAFSLSIDDLTTGISDLVDWQPRHSDSTDFYLSGGHDFIVTDDSAFGVTSIQWYDGSTRGLFLNQIDLDSFSRVPLLSRYEPTAGPVPSDIEDVSLALDNDGDLHLMACESDTGIIQYARGPIDSIGDDGFSLETTAEGLAMSSCDLHFDTDPLGQIFGNQAETLECVGDGVATGTSCSTVSDCEDSSGVIWECQTSTAAGLYNYSFDRTLSTLEFTLEEANPAYLPEQLVMVESDTGTRIVFIDPLISSFVIIEPDGEEWVEPLGAYIPSSVHAIRDETQDTDELVVSIVTETGEVLLYWGSPEVGFTHYTLTPSFLPLESAAWLDPTGEMLLVSVTSSTQVTFGMAYR